MKNSIRILERFGLTPIKQFRVASRSEKGKFHIVVLYQDGHLECNCVAGQFHQNCFHKKRVNLWLQKKKLLDKLGMKAGIRL